MRFLKVFAGGLFNDGRRERAKRLAVFYPPVQNVFHFRTARVGQNAAVSKGARPPFDGALKPSHDFSRGNVMRRQLQQRLLRELLKLDFVIGPVKLIEGCADFAGGIFWPPIRVVHRKFARAAQNLMIQRESGPHERPRIPRRGLNEDALKSRTVEYLAVRDAIESPPPSK